MTDDTDKQDARFKHFDEQYEQVLMLVAEGMALHRVCKIEGLPSQKTVYRKLASDEAFRQKYAECKRIGIEAMAEEIIEIADDGTNDWMEVLDKEGEPTGAYKINGEHVQRSRLRVDTRKWLLAKLVPRKYGDRVDHNLGVEEENPLAAFLKEVSGNTLRPVDDPDEELDNEEADD